MNLWFRSQGMDGRQKRQTLNDVAGITALGAGIFFGLLGWQWFGFLGGLIGFFGGIAITSSWLTKNRFYR